MIHNPKKSFQELFKDKKYISVKNYLYNYLLRKRAVGKCLKDDRPELILEVGSGISPLVTGRRNVVYSDISYEAISLLKQSPNSANYVVADAAHLPFKANMYSHVICSEVLEHLANDLSAICEIFRVLQKPIGRLILTVPHRKCYFGYDDRYVKHYRRYEILEIKERLQSAGFQPLRVQKILGLLEKITMLGVVFLFSIITKSNSLSMNGGKALKSGLLNPMVFLFEWINLFFKGYVWLDARIMPLSFATVVLIESTISRPKSQSYDRRN